MGECCETETILAINYNYIYKVLAVVSTGQSARK